MRCLAPECWPAGLKVPNSHPNLHIHNCLLHASWRLLCCRVLHPAFKGCLHSSATSDALGPFPGGYPNSLTAAVRACKHGVKRTHVIYARTPGALLVELYSRDGLGVMVSGDFFEGVV